MHWVSVARVLSAWEVILVVLLEMSLMTQSYETPLPYQCVVALGIGRVLTIEL